MEKTGEKKKYMHHWSQVESQNFKQDSDLVDASNHIPQLPPPSYLQMTLCCNMVYFRFCKIKVS